MTVDEENAQLRAESERLREEREYGRLLLQDSEVRCATLRTENERLRAAIQDFMSSYRARYSGVMNGVRSNAPMREDATKLNAVVASVSS